MILAVHDANATERWLASTIKAVYPQANGVFILVFNTAYSGQACNAQDQYFYVQVGSNGVNADGAKNIVASSLAAAAQHLTVQVAFDDATVQCYVNRLYAIY